MRFELEAFRCYGMPLGRNVQIEQEMVIVKEFTPRYPSGRHRFPPEESGAGFQVNARMLLVARPGERDERVREIFKERAFTHLYCACLYSGRSFWAAAIEPGSAGGGQLHVCACSHFNVQRQLISAQHAAGYIV